MSVLYVPNLARPCHLDHSRKISASQLGLLAKWLDGEPEVPEGPWYKEFSGMTVCGEGELVKTFLLPGQAAKGRRAS